MLHTFLLSLPGGGEWIVIGVAVLLFFGGRKIPEFMRGLGKGIREFNDAKNGVKEELENNVNTTPNHTPQDQQAQLNNPTITSEQTQKIKQTKKTKN